MAIQYKGQLNLGNAVIGSEKTITANEFIRTAEPKDLAREIHHQNTLIPEQVAQAVLDNLCAAAAELINMGFAVQLKNGDDVMMRIIPDIHVKGGNINLARARQLDSTVTELTAENAGELIDKAGGVTVKVRAIVQQKFTDLLNKDGVKVERIGVETKAYVEKKSGDDGEDGSSGDAEQPAATGPVLTVTKTGAGSFTLTNQAGQTVESGAAVPAGHTLTLRVSAAGSATPTATIGGQTVTLVEDEGRYVGTFLMPSANATLTVKTGGSGDNED